MKSYNILGALLLTAALAACGGGGTDTLTTPPPTTTPGPPGGGGSAPNVAAITVTSNVSAILSDGSNTAEITALVRDANNVLLQGVPVTFSASSGGITAANPASTGSDGATKATLSTAGDPGLRTITVTASAGGRTATTTVQVVATGASSPVSAINVTTSTPTILSDGSTTATITALVRDASNNLVPNVPVVFTASSGGIAASSPTTNASGAATATLSTAGDPALRAITVTARAATLTASTTVQVVAGAGSVTVNMGSGTGTAFQAGTIGISNANLSASGSTSLQVVLQQSDGTLYTQPVAINFSSPCQAQGRATITSPVQTSSGIASATYAAVGCSGSDTITATAQIGNRSLSASGTVTVAAAAIGSIVFDSATPANIALQGTGSQGRPETSTVVFRVLDRSGGPVAGANVAFALNTTVGGLSLAPATAQADANGRVQTVVQAGTIATSVRVTATVQNTTPQISTQSAQLTVTTGVPDQDSFSLAVQCPNVEALGIDGIVVSVTARLADRFNNPVPDGTAVTLSAEGGQIFAQCQTTTVTNGSSGCTVNWTSTNPRPAGGLGQAGRAAIFATAIGEESFTDANGNGAFDNGEAFVDQAERFRDNDEDGVYDLGEPFYDFNNNGVRDPADGLFNGVLCRDTSGRCGAAPTATTGISASNIIVMSGSVPTRLDPAPGTGLTLQQNRSAVFAFRFADVNDNPLPNGTRITATISGTGLTLGQPTEFTVPCTIFPTTYSWAISASATATSGILTIQTETQGGAGVGGVRTVAQYPITVNP
ncbi:MAG: Ig-like domain-containing protein [Steroidobacteraceae bacterium]|jgi:hypothetical protein|nr:Ig-like domain-containing protein [Steroidobacteraceae bacterium]